MIQQRSTESVLFIPAEVLLEETVKKLELSKKRIGLCLRTASGRARPQDMEIESVCDFKPMLQRLIDAKVTSVMDMWNADPEVLTGLLDQCRASLGAEDQYHMYMFIRRQI